MNHLKLLLGFAALFLSSCPQSSIARDSPFTRHGTGPRYWIAYEECFVTNVPLSEERWKANIDWMEKTFKPYGYDMICNDGWIEAAQTVNENGYITKYNSDWKNGFSYWTKYLQERGMKMGVYYNPMWLTRAAYEQNLPVKGTSYHTRDIVGYKSFNDPLYWVDVDKPGAKEWIQNYVRYFKEMGVAYLRIDFLENYETNYGTRRYEQALAWIAEAAAAYHCKVAAGIAQDVLRVRAGEYISVRGDGDTDGALHVADDVPVGASCVHLRAGTAVNHDGRRSCLLADLRKLNCVDAAVIPALAEFDRDGLIHRGHDGLDYPPRKLRRLHQRRAVSGFDDLPDRAPHIYIEDIRAGIPQRHARGLGHYLRLVAEDLHGAGVFLRRDIQE